MSGPALDLPAIQAEYAAGLQELTFNSKPIIDSLTVVAQETVGAATVIVAAIEDRIRTAPVDEKLPTLYLLDSICKFAKPDNVRQVYIASFSRNIVKVFGAAFHVVADDIKNRMEKLMDTWRQQNVFPTHIIRSLEMIIGQWRGSFGPISRPPLQQAPPHVYPVPPMQVPFAPPPPAQTAMLAQQVQALLAAKQQRQMSYPHDTLNNQQLSGLIQLQTLINSGTLTSSSDPNLVHQVVQNVQQMYAQTFPPQLQPPHSRPMAMPTPPYLGPSLDSGRSPRHPLEDTSNTMRPSTPSYPYPGGDNIGRATPRVGPISLTTEDINRRRPGVSATLYEALPQQCRQCGFRFPGGADGTQSMGVHMDFHFRQNKRNMEKGKKMLSRDWYVPVENWIANKEVEVGEEHAPYFGDAPEAKKEKVETEELPKVRAPEGEALVCPICHEKFVRYWDEDEEEWMVRDAVEVDGRIRHYTCHREVAGGGSRARSNSPEPGSLAGRVRSPAVQSGLPKRARTEVDDRESKKLKP